MSDCRPHLVVVGFDRLALGFGQKTPHQSARWHLPVAQDDRACHASVQPLIDRSDLAGADHLEEADPDELIDVVRHRRLGAIEGLSKFGDRCCPFQNEG